MVGRPESGPNFHVYKQKKEGLKNQQAQFKVNTLFLPHTGAHLESSLREVKIKSSVSMDLQQEPIHILVWAGLDEPWPEGRDGNKINHLHSGKRFKILFQIALQHTAQEKGQTEDENIMETRAVTSRPHGKLEHTHPDSWSHLFSRRIYKVEWSFLREPIG